MRGVRICNVALEREWETCHIAKTLLNIRCFSICRYATRSLLDVIWPVYTPQVECALMLLQRMEDDGLCPDASTYDIVEVCLLRCSRVVSMASLVPLVS